MVMIGTSADFETPYSSRPLNLYYPFRCNHTLDASLILARNHITLAAQKFILSVHIPHDFFPLTTSNMFESYLRISRLLPSGIFIGVIFSQHRERLVQLLIMQDGELKCVQVIPIGSQKMWEKLAVSEL